MHARHRFALSLLALVPQRPAGDPPDARGAPDVPLCFEENRGQADPGWRYVARTPGYTLGLARTRCALESGDAPAFVELVGASPEGVLAPEDARATATAHSPSRASTEMAARIGRIPTRTGPTTIPGPLRVRMEASGRRPSRSGTKVPHDS